MNEDKLRIRNLTDELASVRAAWEADKARIREMQDNILTIAEPSRVLELAGTFGPLEGTMTPVVMAVLTWLEVIKDNLDPQQSSPISDTARVGHGTSLLVDNEYVPFTSVEMAYERQAQARYHRAQAAAKLNKLAEELRDMVAPDENRKRVERPKCNACSKRSPVEARCCMYCGQAFGKEEAA